MSSPKVYAFIDSQNMNLGIKSLGWQIDYKKFRLYLKNRYNVEKAFVFIGYIPDRQGLYTMLQAAGFILIFKPTVMYIENGKQKSKRNVDAELVLHSSAIEYPNYDKAIIVSGDGDSACLAEYLAKNQKLLHIFTPNEKYSRLLSPYASYIVRMETMKAKLKY